MTNFEDYLNNSNTAKETLEKYCKEETSRQRDDLYDWLDKKLDIKIDRSAYDYSDKRTDHSRFECTNDDEVKVVIDRIVRELDKK